MKYRFLEKDYKLERYPTTSNRSLRPVSAADELLIGYVEKCGGGVQSPLIQHDRFGVLATVLDDLNPQFVATFSSQQKAFLQQVERNGLVGERSVLSPLEMPEETGLGLMRIPKSLQLFELYLAQFAQAVNHYKRNGEAVLVAGFMTRHFTPALLKVASRYAEEVNQSRAEKKARYLELKGFRKDVATPDELLTEITFKDQVLRQYYGVFSAGKIDYATQFLLDYLESNPLDLTADFYFLDLACGNGIIARELLRMYPLAKGLALDDFSLATSSAKMNLPEDRASVLLNDKLEDIEANSLDLVVTNPPFHFGYETNIEVSLGLFRQAKKVLKADGKLLIVANRHLNYSTHLRQLYTSVTLLERSDKFELLLAQD